MLIASDIKKTLSDHNLHIWQLCSTLGISRSTYYERSHNSFAGYEDQIKNAINSLIEKNKDQKGDNHNAN